MTGSRLVVAIPARDEAARIAAALAAVQAAAAELRHHDAAWQVDVVVAADACTDDTAAIARRAGVAVVETGAGRVGAARAAAIDAGLVRAPDACWIANTDADSRVPRDWLRVHAAAALRDADVLLGSIRPDEHELGRERFRQWAQRNPPQEHHRYVHGANLGVRADAYRAVGGFPDVALDEDVLLVEACRAAGREVRSTDRGAVVTSARLHGRAPGGFSAYLHALALTDEPT